MSRTHISAALRERVRTRAKHRGQYCLTSERITGMPMEIDHIKPEANGGATTEDNLCLACAACNEYKGDSISAKDPDTRLYAPLYHPLQQPWHEHFAWSADGTEIVGLTPTGRATVEALHLNRTLLVGARAVWVSFGLHPPSDA
ncbi:MAG TPA: HNH endonuclease signature motif containing protein [Ktedonobacterales bacterium]